MDSMKSFTPVIAAMLLTLAGCVDENFRTSHPDEGGVVLTTDWDGGAEVALPPVYKARIVSLSGKTQDFDNLSGATNSLVVEPGEATLYVYNPAENITVFGTKATVDRSGAGISAVPETFFSYSGQIYTEQDLDVPHTALMRRRTGDLKLSLAIKPASAIGLVKAVSAELDGVASELDMQTNALSTPSSVSFPLPRSTFYASATLRLLGFATSATPGLRLKVELENGYAASISHDLLPLVKDFNDSKNRLFTLNATLTVAADGNGVTVGDWTSNTESRYLSLSASEVSLPGAASAESVTVATDQPSWEYSIIKTGDWLAVSKTGDQLNLSASENTGTDSRRATVNISTGGLSESITVTQDGYAPPVYSDREVAVLQRATVGKGVNIVLMGDGYTSADMARGDGKYERDMRAATDHFFSVYPYTEYRDYFNVYMVVAVSNEEGISIDAENRTVDTKFEARWEGGRSTGIDCNENTVLEYCEEISELENVDGNDITIIMPINAYIYAGTCMMGYFGNLGTDFGNGFSISMCPVGSSFREVVIHEAGGHGFAKLMDEYVYYRDETIPDEEKQEYIRFKAYGWCENIDFHDDISLTSWRSFANMSKYDMVSTFEGASMYGKGIWRPEYNSCMNNNVAYYNAPGRWAQVRRLKRLAGFDYTFSDFLRDDAVPEYPSEVRSAPADFTPLAPPVIMKMKDFRRNK
ncbi:MAG: hypothetical protein LBJ47_04490 [Tannerella sp.]|jgi:hypothetical protein|nr:hypothetical protein [Tannerella sp.]